MLTLIYSHPGTGLTLGVPEGWEVYPLEDAVVAMISPVRGEEDFFRENIMVTADDQFPDLTLERYVEVLADEVKNRYPDTETLESGDITIADAEGRWMVDRFTGPKGEAWVYRVVLVREGTAYVLHGTAPVWTFTTTGRSSRPWRARPRGSIRASAMTPSRGTSRNARWGWPWRISW